MSTASCSSCRGRSAFVSAFSWKFIFDRDNGLVNGVISALGGTRVEFLDTVPKALAVVIIVNVWLGVPFMMVAMLGGMQSIPGELYEAAEMDSASRGSGSPMSPCRACGRCRPRSSSSAPSGRSLYSRSSSSSPEADRPGAPTILVAARTGCLRGAAQPYSLASSYGVLILSILIVYSIGYRFFLRKQGEVW